MSAIPIVCDNCGARWRLPDNFAAAQSKCRDCGSAIDVARQRTAAEGDGKPMLPAAARPARDRSKDPRPSERTSAAAANPTAEPKSRRRDRDVPKAKSKLPFVLAGLLVLAVVIVLVALK